VERGAPGVVEVSEVTRNGSVVRIARFVANRVLAPVEHLMPRTGTDEADTSPLPSAAPPAASRPPTEETDDDPKRHQR
jgi:hypothetical protein